MIRNISTFFQALLGIHSSEGKKILHFVRLAFFWSLGSYLVETLSIGLFLEKVGADHLPLAYTFTSLGMIFSSTLFLYFFRISSPYRILLNLFFLASITYFIFCLALLSTPPLWFWSFLQISTYIFLAILLACFWTFVDQYHDLQSAKKIYGVYNATYFLGCVASGLCINFFLKHTGTPLLFGLASFCFLCAFIETYWIARQTPKVEEESAESFSHKKKGIFSLLQLFCSSPYVLFLTAMSLIIQLLRTTTEFNYMESLGKIFIGENTLLEFLGTCKAYIALGNILIGVFFYRRFIRRITLSNMILLPPVIFFLVYSQWITYDSLLLAIFGVIAVEGVLFTLEDNNFNLLTNAAPSKIKGILRIINDSFFEPIGMLFSSLFLIFLQSDSKWFGLGLSLCFFISSIIIRNLYPKSIFSNLRQNAIRFEKKISDLMFRSKKKEQKEILDDLFSFLSHPSESLRLFSLQGLLQLPHSSFPQSIFSSLQSLSPEGRIFVLQLLENSPYAKEPLLLSLVESWAQDDSLQGVVYQWSNLYLAKQECLDVEKAKAFLTSSSASLKAAAIITLKRASPSQNSQYSLLHIIAEEKLEQLLQSEEEEEVSLALDILSQKPSPSSADKVLPFLSHSSLIIQRASAQAMVKLSDPSVSHLALPILQKLRSTSDSSLRISCLKALGNISNASLVEELIHCSIFFRPIERRLVEMIIGQMGEATLPYLSAIIQNVHLHGHSRILSGKILSQLALPQFQTLLTQLLPSEIEKAYFYFFYGSTIQNFYPLYDLSLLQDALLSGFQSCLDCILHLLGAAGSIEDSDLLVRSLHSKNAKTHAHAVETLEKNCDIRIFRKILPLIEEIPTEEKIRLHFQNKKKYPKLSLSHLLHILEQSSSLFDRSAAVHLREKLLIPPCDKTLQEMLHQVLSLT